MALSTPQLQPRSRTPRDWGNFATALLLPNAAGAPLPARQFALEAGDQAQVVVGVTAATYTCQSPGTPAVGDAVWATPAPSAVITWGNDGVAASTTTRFLSPWWDDGVAQTVTIQWRAPRPGTLRFMRVHHNVPAGNGNLIVYTVRVNGVATLLLVSMASTAADGSNLVTAVAVAAGDLLDIIVTKALAIGTSPTDIVASLEFN